MSVSGLSAFGPQEFANAANVSRETMDRLAAFVALLTEWNTRHNLVSRNSLGDVWRRHIWDSGQLAQFVPRKARSLVDLGSGAGFPGLVLAAMLGNQIHVVLYEATKKKADFLKAAATLMGLDVTVAAERIESRKRAPADVVTARALAPLSELLPYAQQFSAQGTVCLFLKGQSVASELTGLHKSWRMKSFQHPSLSDPSGVVLEIRELRHAGRH